MTGPVNRSDGSNYFKLRDLGNLIPFDVEWDGDNNKILISMFNLMQLAILSHTISGMMKTIVTLTWINFAL